MGKKLTSSKKLIAKLLTVALVLQTLFIATTAFAAVTATGVTLNKTTLTIKMGVATVANPDATLKAAVTPATAVQTVTFSTSDAAIVGVTVSGAVYAVAPGTATITATEAGGKFKSVPVTVPVPVEGISYTTTRTGVSIGAPLTVAATLTSTLGTIADADKRVTYTSSNPTIASVSAAGVISGVKAGVATITAKSTSYPSISNSVTLTVYKDVKSIIFNKTAVTIRVGHYTKTTVVKATYLPIDASFTTPTTYVSGTPAVATIDATTGIAYGVSAGTSVITVTTTTYGGTKTASYTLTVGAPVTAVSLDNTTATINSKGIGNTIKLTATTVPATPAVSGVYWLSSDTDIATVSATGLVTGKEKGVAKISALTKDGLFIASCVVTVN
jgi:uncharacterized protein YjdB